MYARTITLYDRLVGFLGWIAWLPPLVARVAIGWVFIESGWGKLHGLGKVVEYFRSLGIPMPEVQAPLAATSELVFGATLLAGLFTRISSIPLMVIMAVAIVTAKRADIASASDLYAMQEFLFIALLLWLLVHGGGAISLDRLLMRLRPVAGAPAATRA